MRQDIAMKRSGVPWAVYIPINWNVRRGKTILTLLDRPINDDDEIITCFRDGEVTLRKNRREEGFTIALQENGYQGIEPGDLVVHGMDGFAGAIGISDSRGKATPVLNVMDSTQNKRFLMYYLRALAYKDVFMSLSTGIRVRSCDLRWNKLAVLPFLIPSLDEQQRIVAFLDEQVSQIDSIVADAQCSIEAYKKWKASIVYEVITKGLDRMSELRRSGIEWIGDIPSTWTVRALFQLVTQVKNRNSDLTVKNLLSLSYGNIKRKNIDTTDGLLPASFDGYNIIEANDIVLRLTDLQNDHTSLRVGRSTERGIITSAYVTIRPMSGVNSEYLYYTLHAFDLKKGLYGMGAGVRQGLNYDEVKMIKLPFAPIEVQRQIVEYLNIKCKKIEAVIEDKQAFITKLEKMKRSLIYETVTGQRKVV